MPNVNLATPGTGHDGANEAPSETKQSHRALFDIRKATAAPTYCCPATGVEERYETEAGGL